MKKNKFDFAWLLLNAYCNLRCSYCYEVKYGFKNEEINKEIIDLSVEFIRSYCAEGAEIGIYGGEPLLSFNKLRYLLDTYPVYNYSLFTNTIPINNEILEYLYSKQDFLIMDISIDGDPETQIKNRGVMYNKEIIKKIFKIFRYTGVRMIVVDPEKCYNNCMYLINLGAKRIDLNYPSFTNFPDITYREELARHVDMVNKDVPGVININPPCYMTNKICQIGSKRMAISPRGDIYPCDVFYFLNVYKIGNIFSGFDQKTYSGFMDDLKHLSIPERPCPAHVYCAKRENLL